MAEPTRNEPTRTGNGPARRERRRNGRTAPVMVVSAVAIGAVTASLGILQPAMADEDYPSWDDIQNAKKNETTKKAEIDKVTELISGLQTAADEASRTSMIAAEKHRQAVEALAAAVEREATIRKQADAAAATAKTSKMRAGLLAAHIARTGGKDFSVDLFLNGDKADDLLHKLGTASRLSEQSQEIYRQAEQDRNTADSLAKQADAAATERSKLADEARRAADAADAAARAAEAALATQQKNSEELYQQLASLKDTTVELERERADGIAAEKAAAAAAAAAAAKAAAEKAAADKAAAEAGNNGGNNGGSQPSGGGGGSAPPAPNGNVVETAISFARSQLGKPYSSPGDSWNTWDCSGLTKSAYAYAGVYIGTHSATNQYYTLRDQGRLVPYSQRQRGDLIFWGYGGDYYHVAIYLGGDRILEAPDYGKNVREWYIWGAGDVAGYVGRPG